MTPAGQKWVDARARRNRATVRLRQAERQLAAALAARAAAKKEHEAARAEWVAATAAVEEAETKYSEDLFGHA